MKRKTNKLTIFLHVHFKINQDKSIKKGNPHVENLKWVLSRPSKVPSRSKKKNLGKQIRLTNLSENIKFKEAFKSLVIQKHRLFFTVDRIIDNHDVDRSSSEYECQQAQMNGITFK